MDETNKSNNDMNSIFKNWKAILAIVGVLILVFELIGIGLLNPNIFGSKPVSSVKNGKAEFIGRIRTYEPYLFVPSIVINAELLENIKSIPGVSTVSQESTGILIKVETRDDVYPIALALKKIGLVSYSIANVAPPNEVSVVLDDNKQRINASLIGGGVIKVETQPLIPLDSEVAISMDVGVSGNAIVQYANALLKTEEKEIVLSSTVEDRKIKYIFYIPWEKRNSLNLSQLPTNYSYNKSNVGIFENEIGIDKIVAIKNLDYILYVDKATVVFNENFTDKDKVISDFGINVSFLPSVLAVETKDEKFSLPYNSTVNYVYKVKLQSFNYSFADKDVLEIESVDKIESENLSLKAIAKIVGNTILDLNNVSILK